MTNQRAETRLTVTVRDGVLRLRLRVRVRALLALAALAGSPALLAALEQLAR